MEEEVLEELLEVEEVLEELLEAEEVLLLVLVLQLEVVLEVLVHMVVPVHKELVLVRTRHLQVGNAYVAWEESWLLM